MSASKCNVHDCKQISISKCHCQGLDLCDFHIGETVIEQGGKTYDQNSIETAFNDLKFVSGKIDSLYRKQKQLIEKGQDIIKKINGLLNEEIEKISCQIEIFQNDIPNYLNNITRSSQMQWEHSRLECKEKQEVNPNNNSIQASEQASNRRAYNGPFSNITINTKMNKETGVKERLDKIKSGLLSYLNDSPENDIIKSFIRKFEMNKEDSKTELTPATAASSMQEGAADFISDSQATFVIIDSSSAIIDEEESPKCICIFCSRLFGNGAKGHECGCFTCKNCVLNQYGLNA